MSGVRLTGNSEVLYGSKMPNVIINKITVDYDNGVEDVDVDCRITVNLSVRFTKPPGMQYVTVRDLFRYRELGDLHLHIYLTYADYVYSELSQNIFDISQWLISGRNEVCTYYRENCFLEIPFSTLATNDESTTNEYDSAVVILSTFDEKGNEVIEINNITKEFYYDSFSVTQVPGMAHMSGNPRSRYHPPPPYISQVSSLTLVTFVGLSSDELLENRFNEGDNTLSGIIANKFFGDITYHKILENGKTTNKFYQNYTLPDGTPYYGEILQSVNGKIYSTDDFSFDDIKIRTEDLISDYEQTRMSDTVLDNNIKSLEAIINSSTTKSAVLGEMANYRSVYPNKDSATLSGEFYNKFVVLFSELIQSVESQKELTAQLYYDSLVTDERFSLYKSPYVQPKTDGTYDGINSAATRKGTRLDPSNAYIPNAWFHNSRYGVLQPPLSGIISEEAFEALYGNVDSGILRVSIETGVSEQYRGMAELKEEIKNRFIDEGYPTTIAETMAQTELDYIYSSGDSGGYTNFEIDRALGHELLNPTLNGGDYVELKSGDIKVVSSGMFCFDYEKAVRTHSKISKVLNLKKLQVYFRFNIPYEEFFVSEVTLGRNEYRLGNLDDLSEEEKYINPVIVLNMVTPTNVVNAGTVPHTDRADFIDYPKSLNNEIYYLGGSPGEGGAATEYYLDRLRYFLPGIYPDPESANVDQPAWMSQLYHFNFDLPTSDKSRRLDGLHSLDNYVESGIGTFTSERTYDGYRLMPFYYQDIMDDDVAYYNTSVGSGDLPERIEGLEASNQQGDPTTHYQIEVTCKDLTQLSFKRFINLILPAYNDLVEYANEAEEICNFNNLNNTFNTFFIEKINEKYPEKPWVKAAYVANALSDILFSDTTMDQEFFNQRVLETILKISPENGNLLQVQQFAVEFNGIMQHFYPDSGIDELMDGPGPTDATAYKAFYDLGLDHITTEKFYNEIPITSPITGDIRPAETIETALIRPPPVIPVSREYASGGTGTAAAVSSERKRTTSEYSVSALTATASERAAAISEARGAFDYFGTPVDWVDIEPLNDFGGLMRSTDVDGLSYYSQGNFLQKAYEKLFWPLTINDSRFKYYYGRDMSVAGGRELGSRTSANIGVDNAFRTARFGDAVLGHLTMLPKGTQFPAVISEIVNYEYVSSSNVNMLMFFVGIMCRESSLDSIMNAAGTQAKRRAPYGNENARREYRTLSQIYELVLLYMGEARRRHVNGDVRSYNPNWRLLRRYYAGFEGGAIAAYTGTEDLDVHETEGVGSWQECISDINMRAYQTLRGIALVLLAEINNLDLYEDKGSYYDWMYDTEEGVGTKLQTSNMFLGVRNLGISKMVHPDLPIGDRRYQTVGNNLLSGVGHVSTKQGGENIENAEYRSSLDYVYYFS